MTPAAPFSDMKAADISVTPLPRLAKGGRWRTAAMRSYRGPVLYWITRGQGRVTVAGLTQGFGAHNAIFVPGGTMHGLDPIGQIFGTALFLPPEAAAVMPEGPRHYRVRENQAHVELNTLLEAIGREIEGGAAQSSQAIGAHLSLIGVWLGRQQAAEASGAAGPAALRLMERFTRMIETQLYTGQNLGDYAENLGVTPTHLTRVSRACAGRSASDLLQDRVMFEARRLLSDTPITVRRISEMLGYRSAGYFARAFQRRCGESPSAFRAAAAKGAPNGSPTEH
ncbi:helix-turn-helix domain-containing protein [Alphaproteobacteria bacterium KMM 3653]|uniref:Helix-turn-helix domain-containing protein n=1 Tax=Harenicola maris TaxID=2841044 RepID=A0AAP2CNR2_9RHOB|nr:helix-turn-helix domain-containing protein [Harenicola maris]